MQIASDPLGGDLEFVVAGVQHRVVHAVLIFEIKVCSTVAFIVFPFLTGKRTSARRRTPGPRFYTRFHLASPREIVSCAVATRMAPRISSSRRWSSCNDSPRYCRQSPALCCPGVKRSTAKSNAWDGCSARGGAIPWARTSAWATCATCVRGRCRSSIGKSKSLCGSALSGLMFGAPIFAPCGRVECVAIEQHGAVAAVAFATRDGALAR